MFSLLDGPRRLNFAIMLSKEEQEMMSGRSTRRGFAARFASIFTGVGIAGLFSRATASAEQAPGGVQKLTYEGKPNTGTGFITPLIVHNGVIYIAGQGAHSHDKGETFPKDIENHTRHVMESVKTLVEAGGGTMDSILQLTVYLANIDHYDGMNQVFKVYFPHGGPARTTVAVAALPGDSLVEINCTAAVVNAARKGA
jgi:2-iminobutanoate/2-iminopropanoate deaminase